MRTRIVCRYGVSLIEVIVSFVILVVIAGGVFTVLTSARNVAEVSQAKEEAKGDADLVLKHLQHDIAISQAKIVKNDIDGKPKAYPSLDASGAGVKMMIPRAEDAKAMSEDYVEVAYTLSGKKFFRNDGRTGTNRLLSSNVSKLAVFMLSTDQVSVEIETEVLPKGQKEPVTHNQKVLVTIREAVINNIDKRWLTSDEAVTEY